MIEKSFKQQAEDMRWQPSGVQAAMTAHTPSPHSPVRLCLRPLRRSPLPCHCTQNQKRMEEAALHLTQLCTSRASPWRPESTNEPPAKVKTLWLHVASNGKPSLLKEKKNNNNKGDIYSFRSPNSSRQRGIQAQLDPGTSERCHRVPVFLRCMVLSPSMLPRKMGFLLSFHMVPRELRAASDLHSP